MASEATKLQSETIVCENLMEYTYKLELVSISLNIFKPTPIPVSI